MQRQSSPSRCNREQIVARGRMVAVAIAEADGTPTTGIGACGPSTHTVACTWSWPCSTSSTPWRRSSASSSGASRQPFLPRSRASADGGSAARETASSPASCASICSSAARCASPSRPVAISGAVGTALDSADQRQRAAAAQKRKPHHAFAGLVAAQIRMQRLARSDAACAHIGVVIAGHHGDPLRRADAVEPVPRRREFLLQRQIDQIAGDRDLVRALAPACRRPGRPAPRGGGWRGGSSSSSDSRARACWRAGAAAPRAAAADARRTDAPA